MISLKEKKNEKNVEVGNLTKKKSKRINLALKMVLQEINMEH